MYIEKKMTVRNKQGLHVRPARKLYDIANKFSSNISIVKDDQVVNGKNILDILTLAAIEGTELLFRFDGNDAEAAASAIQQIIETDLTNDPTVYY